MIPFVFATSLASSSLLRLENESQITENVPLLVKTFFWKSIENGLCEKCSERNCVILDGSFKIQERFY